MGRIVLPTGRDLHRLAAESSFAVASLEKVIRLAEMLSGIGELEDLARALALKGGTALNLFLWSAKPAVCRSRFQLRRSGEP